jgi:hypothetical protein
MEPELQV